MADEIKELEKSVEIIQGLSTHPNREDGLTEEQMKEKFDAGAVILKQYLNDTVVPAIRNLQRALGTGEAIGIDNTLSKIGWAADAKAVGEKVTATETEIENLKTGMKPTLLWSNQAPAAFFAQQEVQVPNGADYTMWLIVFRHTSTYGYTQESLCRVSNQGFVYFPAYSVGGNVLNETYRMYSRRADRTAITFYGGFINGSVADYGAVPVQIWGLKI